MYVCTLLSSILMMISVFSLFYVQFLPVLTIPRLRYHSYYKYLEVHFGLVLAEGRHTGEQGLALDPGLGQHQKQCTDQSQVTEQEL